MSIGSFLQAARHRGGGGGGSESPNGTFINTVGPTLNDSLLEVFSITSGGQVAVGGVADGTTAGVIALLYWNHLVYQENASLQWFFKANAAAAWSGPTTDPRGNIALRTADSVDRIGFDCHTGNGTWSSGNLTFIRNGLAYTGVHHVRDPGPNRSAMITLGGDGTKIMFAFNNYPTVASWLADAEAIESAHPGTIVLTEGPNEVDSNSAFTYGGFTWYAAANQAQKDLAAAVRGSAILKNVTKLVAWGLAQVNNSPNQGNLSAWADFGQLHDYFPAPFQLVPSIAASVATEQANVTPGKQIVSGETGLSTATFASNGFGIDDATQATLEFKNLLCHLQNPNIYRVYFYELIDDLPDAGRTNYEFHFGAIDSNGNPKPWGTTMHNFTTLMADTNGTARTFNPGNLPYSITGLDSTGQSLVFQNSNGVFFLAVWFEPVIWDDTNHITVGYTSLNITVTFTGSHSSVILFSPVLSATAQQTLTNVSSISLTLSANPVIIQVTG